MNELRLSKDLNYPTPHYTQLISDMRFDIGVLRRWLAAPRVNDVKDLPTVVSPVTVLETLETVIESAEPGLRLFLNYPTQRLYAFLTKAVDDAASFTSWLSENAVISQDPSLTADIYLACCDRLRASIADWRLALMLTHAQHDWDERGPEGQH